MKFYINNWYKLTIIVFIALSFFTEFWGNSLLNPIQTILMYSFMALLVHQFEEYVFPGGGPVVINRGNFGEKTDYRCYPGNMQSAMIVNNLAYLIYIAAIIFPQAIWLGLGTMFFNLFQLIGHGIQMNKSMKTWYNPGLASVVFLFVPISIYYIVFIINNKLVSDWDWFFGAIAFIFMTLLTTILPVQFLKNKDTLYPISEWQVEMSNKVQKFASFSKNK